MFPRLWFFPLKCLDIGSSFFRLMLDMSFWNHSYMVLPVSPTYTTFLHSLHIMQYITLADLQVMLSRNLMLFASSTTLSLLSSIYWQMAHGLPHCWVPGCLLLSNILLCFECTKISWRLASLRYAAIGGSAHLTSDERRMTQY